MEKALKEKIQNTNFEKVFASKGYAFFADGDYNLNIIGIRNLLHGNVQDNTFNDAIVIMYKVNGEWHKDIFDITTDPGLKSLRSFTNVKGCAILVPGQYRSVYSISLHKNKYPALCQRLGVVKVYRDNNRDAKLDMNPAKIDTGVFGINIHKAGQTSEVVDGWSAGCQVFKRAVDFNAMMALAYKAKDLYGNKFTYTLLTTDDLA